MSDERAAVCLDALLSEAAPTRAEVEAALTLGHAEALELEAERLRLQRRIDRARTFHDPRFEGVVEWMADDLHALDDRLRSLLGRLSDIADRFGSGARLTDRVG